MFMYESYKLFIKQRIWGFIVVLLSLRVISVCMTGHDSHYMIDENEKYYDQYMKKYEGKITPAKEKQIEKEYETINSSNDGLLASEQKNKAFQVIYSQYTYQKEKGSGYILETRGWQSILEHDDWDFPLILCIIIIMTALWGNEYETQMDVMLKSCKKGKYQVPCVKVMLGIGNSIILSVVFQIVQFVYMMTNVGLAHGTYPIQSLEFFQNSSYHISLGMAVFDVFITRLLGAVLVAAMTMLVNIWIKRKTVSMIISMAVVVIVVIVVNKIKKVAILCLIALTLFATGCSKSDNNMEISIEKGATQEKAVWKEKTIEIDYDNNNIICTDKNGKKENLIRDVFPSELIIKNIFICNNQCYYLSENDESSGVCIRKINLDNFNNTLIYDSTDQNIEDYFGIIQEQKQYDEEFNDVEDTKWFFVTHDYIYWKKKYYVVQVDVKSGKKKIITEEVSDDKISYSNGVLKYVDAEGNTETCKCE